MNIDEQRVELPTGPLDLVARAAERFRASPDDLSTWLELKAAVDAARPSRTDPLAKAVSIVLNQLEDGADPFALAAAYGELDSRLNAVRPLDANSLSNPHPPAFEWLVYSWLPWGRVALLAGDGGLGKSRLALRLGAGIAAADPDWLGGISTAEGSKRLNLRLDQPERVVIASWEDDLDESDRRLAALGKHDATGGRVKFVDMADRGPLWAPLGNGHVASIASLTPAGEKLREYTENTGAVLLVIDPLAAAYAGDENSRGLVRAFLSSWDAWARRTSCAVLFVGHTPKNASRTSGSTDWRNAVRSVWTLDYQVPQKPAELGLSGEPGVLVLECEKTNYGAPPQSIYLSRNGGVITETSRPEWVDGPSVVATNGRGEYDDVV